MNKQRDIIYNRRRSLLERAEGVKTAPKPENLDSIEDLPVGSLREEVITYVEEEIRSIVALNAPNKFEDEEYETIVKEFSKTIPFDPNSQKELVKVIKELSSTEEITEKLLEVATSTYESREKALGDEQVRTLERIISLSTIDEKWMDHLDAMESLRDGIWLRGDKKTVLSEYKKEAFIMFESLIAQVESTIANRIFRAQLQPVMQRQAIRPEQMVEQKEAVAGTLAQEVQQVQAPAQAASTQPRNVSGSMGDLAQALQKAQGQSGNATRKPAPSAQAKVGRNEPCPCGSGLKFKKCGLIGAPEHRG